jgi:hypothetical protein
MNFEVIAGERKGPVKAGDNPESTGIKPASETSATESDSEWEQGKTNQFGIQKMLKDFVVVAREGQKSLVKVDIKTGNKNAHKENIITEERTRTKGHKRRRSEEINWSCKKSKVSVCINNFTG